MPTYEYECEACGHVEEVFLPISSDPNETRRCPMDGSTSRRIISANVQFNAGTRVDYPVYNPGLPVAPGEKPGGPSQIVHSRQDLVEKCARSGLEFDKL